MRLILSWILAMSFSLPASLPAQQEALLLKIFTEVQRSSRPRVETHDEEAEAQPLLEDVMKMDAPPAGYEEVPKDEIEVEEGEEVKPRP